MVKKLYSIYNQSQSQSVYEEEQLDQNILEPSLPELLGRNTNKNSQQNQTPPVKPLSQQHLSPYPKHKKINPFAHHDKTSKKSSKTPSQHSFSQANKSSREYQEPEFNEMGSDDSDDGLSAYLQTKKEPKIYYERYDPDEDQKYSMRSMKSQASNKYSQTSGKRRGRPPGSKNKNTDINRRPITPRSKSSLHDQNLSFQDNSVPLAKKQQLEMQGNNEQNEDMNQMFQTASVISFNQNGQSGVKTQFQSNVGDLQDFEDLDQDVSDVESDQFSSDSPNNQQRQKQNPFAQLIQKLKQRRYNDNVIDKICQQITTEDFIPPKPKRIIQRVANQGERPSQPRPYEPPQKRRPPKQPEPKIFQGYYLEYLKRHQRKPDKKIDLGVASLQEVVQECMRQGLVSEMQFSDFIAHSGVSQYIKFIKLINSGYIQKFDFPKNLFTLIDHRRLSETLIAIHPDQYVLPFQLGQNFIYQIHTQLIVFYRDLYALSHSDYGKLCGLIDNIQNVWKNPWWQQIKQLRRIAVQQYNRNESRNSFQDHKTHQKNIQSFNPLDQNIPRPKPINLNSVNEDSNLKFSQNHKNDNQSHLTPSIQNQKTIKQYLPNVKVNFTEEEENKIMSIKWKRLKPQRKRKHKDKGSEDNSNLFSGLPSHFRQTDSSQDLDSSLALKNKQDFQAPQLQRKDVQSQSQQEDWPEQEEQGQSMGMNDWSDSNSDFDKPKKANRLPSIKKLKLKKQVPKKIKSNKKSTKKNDKAKIQDISDQPLDLVMPPPKPKPESKSKSKRKAKKSQKELSVDSSQIYASQSEFEQKEKKKASKKEKKKVEKKDEKTSIKLQSQQPNESSQLHESHLNELNNSKSQINSQIVPIQKKQKIKSKNKQIESVENLRNDILSLEKQLEELAAKNKKKKDKKEKKDKKKAKIEDMSKQTSNEEQEIVKRGGQPKKRIKEEQWSSQVSGLIKREAQAKVQSKLEPRSQVKEQPSLNEGTSTFRDTSRFQSESRSMEVSLRSNKHKKSKSERKQGESGHKKKKHKSKDKHKHKKEKHSKKENENSK